MKIRINEAQCTGCGACVAVCTADAISLIDGVATIEQRSCTQCQACTDACPSGAITAVPDTSMVAQPPVPLAPKAEARPISVVSQPWLASVLALAGQEILPRLIDVLLDTVERRLMGSPTPVTSPTLMPSRSFTARGRGRRRQARFRGGRNGNRHSSISGHK
jgi:NAD-dependent dihydropyrimidine dehydrogenase PreA subunit